MINKVVNMEKKIGDRIYWKYLYDSPTDEMGSATIKAIEEAEGDDINGNPFSYKVFAVDVNVAIEDFNCEDENSPAVVEYQQKVDNYLQERFKNIYPKIFSETPTEEQKQLVDKILKVICSTNIPQELEYKFNYYD